jgi:hypothetical protein
LKDKKNNIINYLDKVNLIKKNNSNSFESSNIQDSNVRYPSTKENESSIEIEKKNKNIVYPNIHKYPINKLIYQSYQFESGIKNNHYSDIFNKIKLQKRNDYQNNKYENILDYSQDDIKNSDISKWAKNPYYRVGKFNSLLKKCNVEVDRGQNLDKYLDKNIHSNDNIFMEIKNKKLIENENKDRMIIEEKKLYKNKYDLLEKEMYEKIKKRINMKISNDFAYTNRKQFNEMIKSERNIDSYNLFLIELNKIKNIQDKKLKIENAEIRLIENILDNTYKQKEYLKNKIKIKNDYYNKMNQKENNLNNYPSVNNIFQIEKSNSMFNLPIKNFNVNKNEDNI